jgi:RecA-family ATPase
MNDDYPPIYPNIRPREIEMIRDLARNGPVKKQTVYEPPDHEDSAFIIKAAGTWLQAADQTQQAGMLFDRFWFEEELCILFADTNAGKSILAMQIGDSISRGEPIAGFEIRAAPATVLYFDFELTDKQFRARYYEDGYGEYKFNPRFLRAIFNPSSNRDRKFSTFQEYISNELENAIINTKAKVLIIDNITCLRYGTYALPSPVH